MRRWRPGPRVVMQLQGPAHVLAPAVPGMRGEWEAVSEGRTVRITLNLEDSEYRELIAWADKAAAETGVARVSQQNALRAILAAGVSNQAAGEAAIDQLRTPRQLWESQQEAGQ